MRTRTLAFLVLITCARGTRHLHRSFKITQFNVPQLVYSGKAEVQISCHYKGNFTMLQIFKGNDEIFRFKPSVWPAIRSFPTSGIASISTNHCGASSCHIQLNNLTEPASGLYRCDLEHDTPPYLYTTRSANMSVQIAPRRMPFIDGFAEEYSEGDEMKAICRIEPGSMVKWYLNGQIVMPLYGLRTFQYKSTRSVFVGEPPMVKLQCIEVRGYTTFCSKAVTARWLVIEPDTTTNNGSKTMKMSVNDCVPGSTSSTLYLSKYSFSIALYFWFLLMKYFLL